MKRKKRVRVPSVGITLILPIEFFFNFLLIVPLIIAIYVSFTAWSPLFAIWFEAPLVGAANYFYITTNLDFITSILTTLLILGSAVPLQFAIGLGLAATFAFTNIRFKKVFITILLTPMMMIPIITGFTFWTMFPTEGPINQILSLLSGREMSIPWLVSPTLALLAVILADLWQWTPFMFIILYAGIMALPAEPMKAAQVLGANQWQIFRRIILPMLKPIIFLAIILRSLEAFKIFDVPFFMTRGGPGTSTQTVSVFLYKEGFLFGNLAQVTAGSLIVMVLIIIVALYVSRPLLRRL